MLKSTLCRHRQRRVFTCDIAVERRWCAHNPAFISGEAFEDGDKHPIHGILG
jgi:hypothetical protein